MPNVQVIPPSTAAQTATLFVALELSAAKWVVAIHSPMADKIGLHTLAGGDSDGLLRLIDRKRAEAEKALGQPVRVVSCHEAGYDGFWLHRLLCSRVIDNHVLDAASILVDRRARRCKTDKVDVRGLLRALMHYWRGDKQVCVVVRPPDPAAEDERRLSRERQRLINERVQHSNRIQGLLMAQGVRGFNPLRRDWEAQLAALRLSAGGELLPHLRAEITRECRRLALVVAMIGEVEAEQKQLMQAGEQASAAARAARDLTRLRGIGQTSAATVAQEAFFRGFVNRRQVAGYFGLAGSPWQSGTLSRDQGIGKAGNARARKMAVELAWLWRRHQPDSALTRWYQERVGVAKGRVRRIMIVALARKLMVALWRYVTTGEVPVGAVFKPAPTAG